MRIYLAAAYQRRLEMRSVRTVLLAMGHEVTSSWIDNEDSPAGLSAPQLRHPSGLHRGRAMAEQDIADIHDADMVISFTDGELARGARHVELGLAYAWDKRLAVCGPREHVFHCLGRVDWYPDWSALANTMATWAVDTRQLRGV